MVHDLSRGACVCFSNVSQYFILFVPVAGLIFMSLQQQQQLLQLALCFPPKCLCFEKHLSELLNTHVVMVNCEETTPQCYKNAEAANYQKKSEESNAAIHLLLMAYRLLLRQRYANNSIIVARSYARARPRPRTAKGGPVLIPGSFLQPAPDIITHLVNQLSYVVESLWWHFAALGISTSMHW